MAVGKDGGIYIVGYTKSHDLPLTPGVIDTNMSGRHDGYIMKLSASGGSLDLCTYIGGNALEIVRDVHVSDAGNVFITGETNSTDFPTTTRFKPTGSLREDDDVFIMKLTDDCSNIEYSTVIGSTDTDIVSRLAIGSNGRPYITGRTWGSDLPVVNADDGTLDGVSDAFIIGLASDGGSIVYSTFLGGSDNEFGNDLVIDEEGSIIAVGRTDSADFRHFNTSWGTEFNGSSSGYIVKLNTSGPYIEFSTLIGGNGLDEFDEIVLDDEDNIYLTGTTLNGDFPTTAGAFQRDNKGRWDIVVMKLTSNVSEMLYSTLIGGTDVDRPTSIRVNETGYVFLCGATYSRVFPVVNGSFDIHQYITVEPFVTIFKPDLSDLVFSSILGPSGNGAAIGLEPMDDGTVIVAGRCAHDQFPTTEGAFCTTYNGYQDVFVMRISYDLDSTPPILLSDNTPRTASTGDNLTIDIEAKDNVGIWTITVTYWFGDEGEPVTRWVRRTSGNHTEGRFTWDLEVPYHSLDPLHYNITVEDMPGHRIEAPTVNVTVLDNDGPSFEIIPTGDPVSGRLYTILANVTDNIELDGAWLVHWYGDDDSSAVNSSMTPLSVKSNGNGTYIQDLTIPEVYLEPLRFYIEAIDVFGNKARTSVRTVLPEDRTDPVFIEDLTSDATTGEVLEFVTVVVDNLGIAEVTVEYWLDSQGRSNSSLVSMEPFNVTGIGNGTYRYAGWVLPTDVLDTVHYVFKATDLKGNIRSTLVADLLVRDNDNPSVLEDRSEDEAFTGDVFEFRVSVSDNIGVASVEVTVWYGLDKTDNLTFVMFLDSVSGTVREYMYDAMKVSDDASVPMHYRFRVVDGAGNDNVTVPVEVGVSDNDPPHFLQDLSEGAPLKGQEFTIDAEVGDNVGVMEVWVEWWLEDGVRQNVTLPSVGGVEVNIPRDSEGMVSYIFGALDAAGNRNTSMTYQRKIRNAPPTIISLNNWDIVEEKLATMDLSDHIMDTNDGLEDLVLSCDDPEVTVDGLTISILRSVWIADDFITLVLTDGEDTTQFNLNLTVANVNDVPVIESVVPENGTVFKTSETVVLDCQVTDEDGDDLLYTWKRGDKTMGTGKTVALDDLDAGRYKIRLLVTDGTVEVESTVIFEIEGSASDGLPFLVMLGIILVAILLALVVGRYFVKIRGQRNEEDEE